MKFHNLKRNTKKVTTGIIGGLVTLVGLVLIPYPGPGWLIVFAGLAILATEFEFAAKVLRYAKDKYDAWLAWVKKQNIFVKLGVLTLTSVVVIATIWLVNGFGIINSVFALNQDWLVSPLFRL
jgi:uncharacterized protein (TIGR02611 family)